MMVPSTIFGLFQSLFYIVRCIYLQISPGEGIWASPSRAMLRDHVVPDIDMKKKEGVISFTLYNVADVTPQPFCCHFVIGI